MAGNRRRRQDNSGVHAFLYVLVVLVLLCGMGYLFYYSRSQANERQEYIRELESKEAATKDVVQVTVPAEPESETISEAESSMPEVQTETQTETQRLSLNLNLRLKVIWKVSQRLRARQSHKVL